MQRNFFFRPFSNCAFWLITIFVSSGSALFAQQTRPAPEETIFTVVEHNPGFPGGLQAMRRYIDKNLHYPDSAAKFNVSGKVYVSFVVEPDGQLTQIELLKGLGFGCDEEALRLVKAMPHWIPGTQSGRPMRVKYNLPIAFGPK